MEVPLLIEQENVISLFHNMAALIVLATLMKRKNVIMQNDALVIAM